MLELKIRLDEALENITELQVAGGTPGQNQTGIALDHISQGVLNDFPTRIVVPLAKVNDAATVIRSAQYGKSETQALKDILNRQNKVGGARQIAADPKQNGRSLRRLRLAARQLLHSVGIDLHPGKHTNGLCLALKLIPYLFARRQ
jgi:hypothetical protein